MKDIINKNTYKNNVLKLCLYSATWCNFCKDIKQKIENDFELVNSEEINKEDFKRDINDKIPYIQIYIDDVLTHSIQTSNYEMLLYTINNNEIDLKEDF